MLLIISRALSPRERRHPIPRTHYEDLCQLPRCQWERSFGHGGQAWPQPQPHRVPAKHGFGQVSPRAMFSSPAPRRATLPQLGQVPGLHCSLCLSPALLSALWGKTCLLPAPPPIHLPVHFCFQCNVPPQALPPPLPPRLHQPTPSRLNPHGAPTAAMPCGSELGRKHFSIVFPPPQGGEPLPSPPLSHLHPLIPTLLLPSAQCLVALPATPLLEPGVPSRGPGAPCWTGASWQSSAMGLASLEADGTELRPPLSTVPRGLPRHPPL